jgi:hypothetical protein
MDMVCVLCRQRSLDRGECGLILGVFPSALAAMAHAHAVERVPIGEWVPPRPGRRYWLVQTPAYAFAIQMHPVREPDEPPLAVIERPVVH